MNGDVPLMESEVNNFISVLLNHNIVFQAFHQHLPMNPQIWFVHFRATGDSITIAKALRDALNVTAIPLPQTEPSNPTTKLDVARLETILRGTADVGDDGVVTVHIDRRDLIFIEGLLISPKAGISTSVQFNPKTGDVADVVVDFSMRWAEVTPVVKLMLSKSWYQGCLYNQEIGEIPQLFYDHMMKTGDAYQLATQIRQGLDLTNA